MSAEAEQVREIAKKIATLRKTATELREIAADFEAVRRNADRILASVKMLEINVTDILGADVL